MLGLSQMTYLRLCILYRCCISHVKNAERDIPLSAAIISNCDSSSSGITKLTRLGFTKIAGRPIGLLGFFSSTFILASLLFTLPIKI